MSAASRHRSAPLATAQPLHADELALAARTLLGPAVTPASIARASARYAMEARRAGQRPEAMVIGLKALYAEARRVRGVPQLWSARRPSADPLLSFILSQAIVGYFAEDGAA